MKTKKDIVQNWLPRYTGTPLEQFGKYILLVNFSNYVTMFARMHGTQVCCEDKPMPNASADGISIINFGMGSANAATVMDLLSAIQPKACLFLGKCGGLKEKPGVGEFILPIAAIRGEGASNLPNTEHTLTLVKRTEASIGSCQFLGFELGGELLPAPARPARRIEVIGDSICCGTGDEAVNESCRSRRCR
jgi:hypothetical protein